MAQRSRPSATVVGGEHANSASGVQMYFVTAPHEVRRKRVLSRDASRAERFAFEVTAEMVDFTASRFAPPTDVELATSNTFSSK